MHRSSILYQKMDREITHPFSSFTTSDFWSEITKYMIYPFKWSDGKKSRNYPLKANTFANYFDGDAAVYYGYKSLIKAKGHLMSFKKWREYISDPDIVLLVHPYVHSTFMTYNQTMEMYTRAVNSGIVDIVSLENPEVSVLQLINFSKDLKITITLLEKLRQINLLWNADIILKKINKKTEEGVACVKFLYEHRYLNNEEPLEHYLIPEAETVRLDDQSRWGAHLIMSSNHIVVVSGPTFCWPRRSYKTMMYVNIKTVRYLLRNMITMIRHNLMKHPRKLGEYQDILVKIGMLDKCFDYKNGEQITISPHFRGALEMSDAQVEFCYNALTLLFVCMDKCDTFVKNLYPGRHKIQNRTLTYAILCPRLIHLERFGLVPKFVDLIQNIKTNQFHIIQNILYWSAEHPTSEMFSAILSSIKERDIYETLIQDMFYQENPVDKIVKIYKMCHVSNNVFQYLKKSHNETGIFDQTVFNCHYKLDF